jgi:hypothetical protein
LAAIAKRVTELETQLRESRVSEVRLGTYLDVAVEVLVFLDEYLLPKEGGVPQGSDVHQMLGHGRRVIGWRKENRKG